MDPQAQDQTPVVEEQAVSPVDTSQEVAARLSESKNVLVTVGTNPSVDELASALGLTMLLNKISKHVTAVFSGKIPSAMEFLDPEATFKDNVDSLRDFIIALDKEKADKLRYKVEDDVVKVFITPYQTVITEKDLTFSQGDLNVDVVVALGVKRREALDSAILAHGRILHDAEIITITAGVKSTLGSLDWNDAQASSIAEMLARLSNQLGDGLIDEPIGTALLTGIVAETNRFSNEKTSPSVMTIAAQLMAAGANQQLVATNLRQEGMISESIRTKVDSSSQSEEDNSEVVLNHPGQKPQKGNQQPQKQVKNIQNSQRTEQKPQQSKKQNFVPVPKPPADTSVAASVAQKNEVSSDTSGPTIGDLKPENPQQSNKPELAKVEPESLPQTENKDPAIVAEQALPEIKPLKPSAITEPPTFGGTLNATTGAADDARQDELGQTDDDSQKMFEHSESTEQQDSKDAVESARRAIEDASTEPAVVVEPQPAQSVEVVPPAPIEPPANQIPSVQSFGPPTFPSSSMAEPTPVDDFMQPHTENNFAPANMGQPFAPTQPQATDFGQQPSLPPLPPMPGGPGDGLPPLPPLPGAPIDPSAGFQPQINPGFMESVNQSQNHLTESGEALAAQNAQASETRQAKLDEIGSQYDAAVEKNREIQGLPSANDHTTFPLPPPPHR